MSIKHRIREWLGVDELAYQASETQQMIKKLAVDIGQITPGLGHVIAKLDANYARPEIDPKREAESQALGEEVIKKLKAEDWARRHTVGET